MAAIGDDWSPAEVDAAMALLANSDGKFPSGMRKLPAELVSAVQRERLIAAMLQAAAEIGYRDVSVQDVLDCAGISRPTFYEHFDNKEDCFLAALDATASRLRDRIVAAAEGGGERWRERLRLGLEELLRFCGEEPEAARVLVVEARGASALALRRRDELLDHFAGRIDGKARELVPGIPARSSVTAAGIVGGIESVLYSHLNRGDLDDLQSLLPSLLYFIVLSYEGPDAASEELAVTA
ncbi:MAG TPA: TetR/AcrR family transcriptional regulator [Solirubrobacterales bacterium]|nr:TetR/AcrR family transcriptional regulator [Solirubrobacterales bacterium]